MEEKIGKLTIAAHHVMAALQMIATRCNPYSIHLLAMAAEEIVESVAARQGIILPLSADRWIKPEHRKEWLKGKRKFSNFFKHADRDHDAEYVGPDVAELQKLNDVLLLMVCYSLVELGYNSPAVFGAFTVLTFSIYPDIYDWEGFLAEHPMFKSIFDMHAGNISRREYEWLVARALTIHGALDLEM